MDFFLQVTHRDLEVSNLSVFLAQLKLPSDLFNSLYFLDLLLPRPPTAKEHGYADHQPEKCCDRETEFGFGGHG